MNFVWMPLKVSSLILRRPEFNWCKHTDADSDLPIVLVSGWVTTGHGPVQAVCLQRFLECANLDSLPGPFLCLEVPIIVQCRS